jgi:hypothetical protein
LPTVFCTIASNTFGASAAVGLISGLAQFLTGAGFGTRTSGPVIITGNVGDATAQASSQTMGRFLNRLPNITIREGHRVKVYLTNDLELPVYQATPRTRDPGLRLAGKCHDAGNASLVRRRGRLVRPTPASAGCRHRSANIAWPFNWRKKPPIRKLKQQSRRCPDVAALPNMDRYRTVPIAIAAH